jgi:hypothetical protein
MVNTPGTVATTQRFCHRRKFPCHTLTYPSGGTFERSAPKPEEPAKPSRNRRGSSGPKSRYRFETRHVASCEGGDDAAPLVRSLSPFVVSHAFEVPTLLDPTSACLPLKRSGSTTDVVSRRILRPRRFTVLPALRREDVTCDNGFPFPALAGAVGFSVPAGAEPGGSASFRGTKFAPPKTGEGLIPNPAQAGGATRQ